MPLVWDHTLRSTAEGDVVRTLHLTSWIPWPCSCTPISGPITKNLICLHTGRVEYPWGQPSTNHWWYQGRAALSPLQWLRCELHWVRFPCRTEWRLLTIGLCSFHSQSSFLTWLPVFQEHFLVDHFPTDLQRTQLKTLGASFVCESFSGWWHKPGY